MLLTLKLEIRRPLKERRQSLRKLSRLVRLLKRLRPPLTALSIIRSEELLLKS